jgi:hypothetical protein
MACALEEITLIFTPVGDWPKLGTQMMVQKIVDEFPKLFDKGLGTRPSNFETTFRLATEQFKDELKKEITDTINRLLEVPQV